MSAPARLVLGREERPAHCVNLSMGGAGLRTDTTLHAGATVKIQVDLEGHHRIRTVAEVVRSSGASLSVRFTQLDPASMLAILSNVR